jgi:hypothetical protein
LGGRSLLVVTVLWETSGFAHFSPFVVTGGPVPVGRRINGRRMG